MTDAMTPADHVAAIAASRDRLLAFVAACPDDEWQARPLHNTGDSRTVGVIVDHVADSYQYIGAWISAIVADQDPVLGPELVDRLNAAHATDAATVTRAEAATHLRRNGDAVVALINGLAESDLDRDDGRVGRLCAILARHPDDHRTELEAALRG